MKKKILIAIFSLLLFFNCNEMFYIGLGDNALKKGNIKKAEKYYRKAIDVNKESDIPYQQLGYLYQYEINNIDSAIVLYNKGLKLNPNNYSINFNIMYAYFDKGEIKKGIKYYKKLSRLSSDNDIYYLPMDIIDSLLIGLDIEDKISLCKKYLEINNMDFNLRKRLINIYKKLQNYSKLEEELIKYLNILPDGIKEYELERGEVYFDLGFCNFKMHNYDKSLKYFKLADSLGISIPIEFYNEINAKINN